MTKLEKKLIQLGYSKVENLTRCWTKEIGNARIDLWFNQEHTKLSENYGGVQIKGLNNIKTYSDMNDLQQAFNQLQNDLKELKECQD